MKFCTGVADILRQSIKIVKSVQQIVGGQLLGSPILSFAITSQILSDCSEIIVQVLLRVLALRQSMKIVRSVQQIVGS